MGPTYFAAFGSLASHEIIVNEDGTPDTNRRLAGTLVALAFAALLCCGAGLVGPLTPSASAADVAAADDLAPAVAVDTWRARRGIAVRHAGVSRPDIVGVSGSMT